MSPRLDHAIAKGEGGMYLGTRPDRDAVHLGAAQELLRMVAEAFGSDAQTAASAQRARRQN